MRFGEGVYRHGWDGRSPEPQSGPSAVPSSEVQGCSLDHPEKASGTFSMVLYKAMNVDDQDESTLEVKAPVPTETSCYPPRLSLQDRDVSAAGRIPKELAQIEQKKEENRAVNYRLNLEESQF